MDKQILISSYDLKWIEARIPEIVEFWNENFNLEFNLTIETFKNKILKDAELSISNTLFAVKDSKIIAMLITKISDNSLPEYQKTAWISCLAVKKEYRNNGIACNMYRKTESSLKSQGIEKILIGGDMKPIFSGIPAYSQESIQFFEKIGFILNSQEHYDLVRDISNMDFNIYPICRKYRKPEFFTQKLTTDKIPSLLNFLEKEFPGRWKTEIQTFLSKKGDLNDIIILCEKDRVKGFCKIKFGINNDEFNLQLGPNWGGLGPIGVSNDIRGMGQGIVLLFDSLQALRNLGAHKVIIDWTILKEFYGKLGFLPWRTYVGAYKELTIC